MLTQSHDEVFGSFGHDEDLCPDCQVCQLCIAKGMASHSWARHYGTPANKVDHALFMAGLVLIVILAMFIALLIVKMGKGAMH